MRGSAPVRGDRRRGSEKIASAVLEATAVIFVERREKRDENQAPLPEPVPEPVPVPLAHSPPRPPLT